FGVSAVLVAVNVPDASTEREKAITIIIVSFARRYTDKECDPANSQLDTSAAGVEAQVRSSQAVIQWNVLFGA
ncbi:MAG: hypothetical protein PV344_04640, partial [Anaplasma sp.]|nr:hypothetical protein [Anaplasma sp.]